MLFFASKGNINPREIYINLLCIKKFDSQLSLKRNKYYKIVINSIGKKTNHTEF